MSKLNIAQQKAVTWGEGPLLVLAGPGSGKTFVIVNRILYLLEKGVPPESILVITFTKEAAMSMQLRFQNSSLKMQPVNFGTFHSVFYHILRESGSHRQWNLIKESQKRNILSEIIRKYLTQTESTRNVNEVSEDAEGILGAISLYKNTGDLERAHKKVPFAWKDRFRTIFQDYCDEVKRLGMIEYDDMVYECRELLKKDEAIRSYWQNRFTHILIDEFQDCNTIQYETLKLIAGSHSNIFAVGDDDQSIYGFRGACPDILMRFSQEYQGAQVLLDINYRSREEIVNASLSVIRENENRFPKELKASKAVTGKQEVDIFSFEGREQEHAYLLSSLRAWQQLHEKDGVSCAVLFRTNAYMQSFAAGLSRAGIPFWMKEKARSIYEHFVVKDIMSYLLLSSGAWKRESLLRVMNRPMRYISREAVGEGRRIEEILAWYRSCSGSGEGRQKVIGSLENLSKQLHFLGGLSPAHAISYIMKGMRYQEFLKNHAAGNQEKYAEWMELTEWLKLDAAGYGNVGEWYRAQEEYTRKLQENTSDISSERKKEETIRLMTVHGAKGLEFEKVIIPDCNEKVFPHGNLPDRESVEEERRIFYVAMTRAKENLELLYLTGDKARPRLPSRFLNPLLHLHQ